MDFYSATIRLQGNMLNEVVKRDLTAPEIIVLRRIHGDDAVVKIEKTGSIPADDFDSQEERERLDIKYGRGLASIDEESGGKTTIGKMFGEGYAPLPQALPEFRKKEAEKAKPRGQTPPRQKPVVKNEAKAEAKGRQAQQDPLAAVM